MPAGDVQGENRFHVHRYVCLPLDDALDRSLQFVRKAARFKIQSGRPDRSPGTRRVNNLVPNPCRVGGLIVPWSCSCHWKQNSRPESESFISHSAVTFPSRADSAPCFEEFVINS